ncbi:MAG: hypothetical protein IKV03_02455 [Alphaproteobacteria bacterium]|nr:hypothetical protein [Alphaproteobacteria bacterium]
MIKKVSLQVPKSLKKSNPAYAEAVAKFWMVIASIFIGLNMFFVLTLMQMTPRLRVVPQILTTDSMYSLQLIQTEPFENKMVDKDLIEQMIIRFYLTERHTRFADAREMLNRWGASGAISYLSSPKVYREFYAGLGEIIENIDRLPYTQGIDIRKISRHNDTWTVEFDLYRLGSGISHKETRVAVLESREVPSRRFFGTKFSNPYGFIIINYTDTQKKQSVS